MIETLHIENIGIIDNITVDFKKGLNIITGETGSIVMVTIKGNK